MTDEREDLRQLLSSVLTDACSSEQVGAAEGHMDRALWKTLSDLDLLTIGRPESEGGAGGDLLDAALVVRMCASFAAPVPIGDALMVAPWLRSQVGLPHRDGVVVVVSGTRLRAERNAESWSLKGTASQVGWAAVSDSMIVLAESDEGPLVAEIDSSSADIGPGVNAAGEPCALVSWEAVLPEASVRAVDSRVQGELDVRRALVTALSLAGALDQVLNLCVEYVKQREQFGKPLASFQSIRQQIALLAGESLVAGAAVEGATQAVLSQDEAAEFAVLAARVRSARSATTASRIAHQVHGAIGFTREHPLQLFTRRLWAWRDEHGTEGQWEQRLGDVVKKQGAEGLWPSVTQG